jgi:hypothetical protein
MKIDLESIRAENAANPEAWKLLLPLDVMQTFIAANNGGPYPTMEQWARAALLTAGEASRAGAEVDRLRGVEKSLRDAVETQRQRIAELEAGDSGER